MPEKKKTRAKRAFQRNTSNRIVRINRIVEDCGVEVETPRFQINFD